MDELIEELKNEALWTLFALNTIQRRYEGMANENQSRLQLSENLMMLEALTQQAVLRICRTDDDLNGIKWLRRLPTEVQNSGATPTKVKMINDLIKEFRTMINPLKVKHRNTFIAHLKEAESATPRAPYFPPELTTATEKLCQIIDAAVGHKISYSFRPDKYGPALTLRS